MATLTIRNLDERTKQGLRYRAAAHGVSMEQEVRSILDEAVHAQEEPRKPEENLYDAIRRLVEPHGGFEIKLPERSPIPEPPKFE